MKVCWLLAISTAAASGAGPAITLYNQGFAVIRETIPVVWSGGVSEVRFDGVSAHLEPESVILKAPFRIREQNYRNDPISQNLLLSLFEGKVLSFQTSAGVIQGKVIRSGYTPHYQATRRYGETYAATQYNMASNTTPVIEVDGRLIFGLPGTPLFPSLAHDTLLRPTLTWLVESAGAGQATAELSYVTRGMAWNADYNISGNEKDSTVDVTGWVTMDNQTGRAYEDAGIQLMAGDVNKQEPAREYAAKAAYGYAGAPSPPAVVERAFDEYHLYTLQNRVTLKDRETKQVEFLRAGAVRAQPVYVYDGMQLEQQYRGYGYANIRHEPSYGTRSNTKVWVMREIENSAANHLGMALPAGKVRFYTRDGEGRLQFTGENTIAHTPRGERLRLYTGNAFDLVGERIRRDFRTDAGARFSDESFEIKLRNRKDTPVTIRVVEHLYREQNWTVTESSVAFTKTDSNTIEFVVTLRPGQERSLTYKAHYTW